MTTHATFRLPLAPRINAQYAQRTIRGVSRRVLTREARAWTATTIDLVVVEAYRQGVTVPTTARLAVEIIVHDATGRRARDVDASVKACLDAVTTGLGVDDSRVDRVT